MIQSDLKRGGVSTTREQLKLMANYILADHPEMTAREALNESKRITTGHKGELFVLYLSFLGWQILAPFTLGILYIWLLPYMQAAFANFYRSITAQTMEG